MKSFFVRVLNLLLIAGVIFAYNAVLKQRGQAEEIARLEAELAAANLRLERQTEETAADAEQESAYKDGVYEGSGTGFGGEIKVKVTVEKGKIMEVSIESAEQEDKAYFETAKSIVGDILEKQSADVDTVSGATFSSTGIREAAAQALEKAMGD